MVHVDIPSIHLEPLSEAARGVHLSMEPGWWRMRPAPAARAAPLLTSTTYLNTLGRPFLESNDFRTTVIPSAATARSCTQQLGAVSQIFSGIAAHACPPAIQQAVHGCALPSHTVQRMLLEVDWG